jgi:hypothetical protein
MSSITNGRTGFLRGPDHAKDVFGLGNEALFINNPKTKFEHFVKFNITEDEEVKKFHNEAFTSKDFSYVAALAKSVQYPNIQFESEVANQYNKKRHYYRTIQYDPITIVLHDVADGKTLDFWKMYYNYYFKNGHHNKAKVGGSISNPGNSVIGTGGKLSTVSQSDFSPISDSIVTNSNEHDAYGLNLHNAQSELLSSIEIIFARGKKFEKVVLINPKISAFSHDTFSYEDTSGLMEITLTFVYETVIYDKIRSFSSIGTSLSASEPRRLKIKPPNINVKSNKSPQSSSTSVGKSLTELTASATPKIPSAAPPGPPTLGQKIAANVQKSFGPLSKKISSDLIKNVKQGVKTGNFVLSPNPADTVRQTAKNVGRNQSNIVIGTAEKSATSIATERFNEAIKPSVDKAANASALAIKNIIETGSSKVSSIIESFNDKGQDGADDDIPAPPGPPTPGIN